MKKLTMFLAAAMMVLSLAACTPTPVKQTSSVTIPPEALAETGGISDKVPDPNVDPMDIVSIYSANENLTGLNQAMDAVDELDAQPLADKLAEYGVLDEGTKVLNFEIKDKVGILNLSKIPSRKDAAEEKLMLSAIGKTFIENYNKESEKLDVLEHIKLLVNGKNYSGSNVRQGDHDYLEID